jgi:hypothetical protein
MNPEQGRGHSDISLPNSSSNLHQLPQTNYARDGASGVSTDEVTPLLHALLFRSDRMTNWKNTAAASVTVLRKISLFEIIIKSKTKRFKFGVKQGLNPSSPEDRSAEHSILL